jgi:glutamine synthetase
VKVADETYVNVNIHKKENEKLLNTLATLPDSCAASADCLEAQRAVYEEGGVFSPAMIDGILAQLRAFNDRTLRRDIQKKPGAVAKLVKDYFYCG